MSTNHSFIPLANVFVAWLCVFSTYGNAASYDDKAVNTQSALAATSSLPDSRIVSGFPGGIGGGGNNNGGSGSWWPIWTPFGWIHMGGGGNRPGGGGGGSWFHPFRPNSPSFPNHNPSPIPFKPIKPNPCNPKHPSKPVIPIPNPKPVTPIPQPKPVIPIPEPKPVTPIPEPKPVIPTPKPVKPKPCHPTPNHPSKPGMPNPFIPPNHFKPTPGSSGPQIPPWLEPFFNGGGKHPSPVNSVGTQSEASVLETSKTLEEGRHRYYQCWSVLEKVDKCVDEVLTAFSSRKFQVLGSACCSAIEKMDKDCHARTIGNFHDHFFSASVHRHCSAN